MSDSPTTSTGSTSNATMTEHGPLAALVPTLVTVPEMREAHARLDRDGRLILGVLDAAKPAVAAALWHRARKPMLIVVPRESDAEGTFEQVRAWVGAAAMRYPARRALAYARDGESSETTTQRVAVAAAIARGSVEHSDRATATPPLIVASAAAIAERTLRPADLGRGPGTVRVGQRLDLSRLAAQLVEAGYTIEPLAERPGQAARRGGLLDVFPPGASDPVRIEFFGDEVESIRRFSAETQRSFSAEAPPPDAVALPPATEWFPTPERLTALAADLATASAEQAEADRREMQAGTLPSPIRYGPLTATDTLLDHLPPDALLVIDERDAVSAAAGDHDQLARERRDDLAGQGELTAQVALPHIGQPELTTAFEQHRPRIELARWATGREPGSLALRWAQADAYAGRLGEATSEIGRALRRGDRIVLATQQAQRLHELLTEASIDAPVQATIEAPPAAGSLALLQTGLTSGWRLPTGDGWLTLVTDRELFGFVKKRRTLPRSASQRSRFFSEIEPGDIVVHSEHGIARFAGITRRDVSGEERDYLELRFAGEDRLYVPTEHVDRVTRYAGPSGQRPRLTRLGTQEWTRTRARVRAAVEIVAADLLRLYAARQLLDGHAYARDTEWQRELEAAFPHEETDDQLRAIAEVKADMESPRPMDRVVCGDVGFGKTEVAVRAAFKAVADGFQVAILVPTTVLAEQHERTFRERLAPFPTRIEVLSRFRTDTEIRETIAAARRGEVDIVIGTHRLLQADVEFNNLGLVVIDEEQRFGVSNKERLKRMRLEVDVLALSATPIPRTMHMALTGIRDMSSIDTAPVERHPVQTYVTEWDPPLVREALLHEIERGGQAYVVHNRVQSIDAFAERLRELVPEARIAIGHGQMSEQVLKRVMERFASGEFDVLICTTIIESGIDIANVNTLIIDRADRFGLAQLYQLRGRVGRSAQQAHAYMLHPADRPLTETAQQRLATIFEANELGAGFQVALRDLEIRGAGNLLGASQSGQIATVGFDLYTEMLADAVTDLRQPSTSSRQQPPPSRAAVPSEPASPFAPPPAKPRDTEPRDAGRIATGTPRSTNGSANGHAAPPAGGDRIDPAGVRKVVIDLPVAAHIPESYAPEIEARLALYQRIAGLGSLDEVAALRAETTDRLGELPPPLDQLLRLVRLRIAAARARIGAVRIDGGHGGAEQVVITSAAGAPFATRRLPRLPEGVERLRTQLRVPRAALGDQWLDAIEALIRLTEPSADAPVSPVTAASPSASPAARSPGRARTRTHQTRSARR